MIRRYEKQLKNLISNDVGTAQEFHSPKTIYDTLKFNQDVEHKWDKVRRRWIIILMNVIKTLKEKEKDNYLK